jgi:hypothetical protein
MPTVATSMGTAASVSFDPAFLEQELTISTADKKSNRGKNRFRMCSSPDLIVKECLFTEEMEHGPSVEPSADFH